MSIGNAERKKSEMIDITMTCKYLNMKPGVEILTSLRDYNSFKLTLGKALSGQLIIPGFVQMRAALKDPHEAQNNVTYDQYGYGCLQGPNKVLGDCDAQKEETYGDFGECKRSKRLEAVKAST